MGEKFAWCASRYDRNDIPYREGVLEGGVEGYD